jgi:hypothetical protein
VALEKQQEGYYRLIADASLAQEFAGMMRNRYVQVIRPP